MHTTTTTLEKKYFSFFTPRIAFSFACPAVWQQFLRMAPASAASLRSTWVYGVGPGRRSEPMRDKLLLRAAAEGRQLGLCGVGASLAVRWAQHPNQPAAGCWHCAQPSRPCSVSCFRARELIRAALCIICYKPLASKRSLFSSAPKDQGDKIRKRPWGGKRLRSY